jgi:adenylate cyclase
VTRELSLSERLRGTLAGHIGREYLSNSAYFPVANILLELLREGPAKFFSSPDPYVLLLVGLFQAYWLGRWQFEDRPRPLAGNLIGPAVYTLIEGLFEGAGFFLAPHHIAYWLFALVIGLCQQARLGNDKDITRTLSVLAENLARTGILLAMYWLFESYANPADASLVQFFADPSHVYIAMVLTALGFVIGFAQLNAENHLAILRETATQLRRYSEWALGRELLSRAVQDAETLSLQRKDRTLVFADIRGFTAWSEQQAPEQVVEMLNAFYLAAENAVAGTPIIKTKFTADEVLLVFAGTRDGIDAARNLQQQTAPLLARYGLTAGIGVHTGPVVEGLLGSDLIKAYDVIGDSVNLAKRLCDSATGGEILVSEAAAQADAALVTAPTRELTVKGKARPVLARVITAPLHESR